MAADAIFMKGHQQGNRDILVELPLVTAGAFAAFPFVPVAEHIKIMVTDPAAIKVLVRIVVELYRRLVMFTELSAFKVHDSLLDPFILGPY